MLPTSLAATVPTLHKIPLTCPGISRPPVCHNRKGKHRPLLQYTILSFGEDSDYVFVNLWGGSVGTPFRYWNVTDLVARLRERSGVAFSAHTFRHTYATGLLRRGVPAEVVQKLLGHASVTTTTETYQHLKIEDIRRVLDTAGCLGRPAMGGETGTGGRR